MISRGRKHFRHISQSQIGARAFKLKAQIGENVIFDGVMTWQISGTDRRSRITSFFMRHKS